MNLNELPGLITKHVGMLKAAAGEILDNPGFKTMQSRQSLWDTTQDQLDTVRGNTYGVVTQGRPALEGLVGVSDDTAGAVRVSAASGLPGADSGDQDTMRHLALQARLQRNHPRLASPLGTLHEVAGLLGGQTREETQRDLRHNALGRKIGEHTDSDAESDQAAQQLASTALSRRPMSMLSAQELMAHRQKVWGP